MDASSGSTDPLPPSWFWKWLETASQEALETASQEVLDAAQQAISTEKQARLDEEKTRVLQFWAKHPVPCNRCCMYHDEQGRRCPCPCAHTASSPEQGRRCPCPCAHTASSPEADMTHSVSEWHRRPIGAVCVYHSSSRVQGGHSPHEHGCHDLPCNMSILRTNLTILPTHAGGIWGMKRSGANEDTSSLPRISALDAELTYLQRPPLCGRLERPPLCGRLDGRRCLTSFT